MSIPQEFDTINTSKYLFLRGLSEPWDNALTIISQGGRCKHFRRASHQHLTSS